ncbi:MAG TPA: SHOCT domain-containing protein [Acidimicrobiales bacterium]|nr:SHOCT domain-containing protein [Acidimicrobiales bacterium]
MLVRRGIGRVGRPGLIGTVARTAVVAGTATAVAGGMSRRQGQRSEQAQEAAAYEQQQAMAAQAPPPPPPPPAAPAPAPAPAGGDEMKQLQQLADMRSQGLLDDQEFAAAKAKLLGL